ncbi:DNA helicase UvrD [Salinibacterium hongtaonis]|uniref:DNA 3'-5' helicase n=1 Tax=Homoserinimonas hongtaonis TaxID=2079791 RepID=A0A2U1SZU2_9MICO|nr:DNA helicase UvrD [Salinibacterium hongtaonis]
MGRGKINWAAELVDDKLVVTTGDSSEHLQLANIGPTRMRVGFLTSSVEWGAPSPLRLIGLSHRDARDLRATVDRERARVLEGIRLSLLIDEFDRLAVQARNWARDFFAAAKEHMHVSGWLTREFTETWATARPQGRFDELLGMAELSQHRAAQGGDVLEAIDLWGEDLGAYVGRWNERFLEQERRSFRSFFDNVERSPLTDEQAAAVVCFDNRVQLIAAAGSGKTSTMIAKAGYAVYRGIVTPDQVLMLAFNSKAASELQQRITERLAPLGLAADRIVARTFHSFGLAVIGQATGRKPSLAPWVETAGADVEKLAQIVDLLRDNDEAFRTEWDLFRMVFSRELPDFGDEEKDPDGWDAALRREGFRTLQNEVVKSQGERMIADWLFYNGVTYEYERRYEIDTADAERRQYQPDFFYPDIDAYHEHFALDEQGQAPADFIGYMDGVAWKRRLHAEHDTELIETTMAQLWDGSAFTHLRDELTSRGIVLDPDPERPVNGQPPIENERLVGTFRSFMVHAKSNQLSDAQLFERAGLLTRQRTRFRQEMFLRLYQRIRDRWEDELRRAEAIDFEDMLNLAADHIESGRWRSPFRLVMVDEMQDASFARARLARALVTTPGHYLFAVGDDWQSINRFAGADLSVMTGFEEWFGKGEILRLERTFRCPQSICDVSSRFVAQNPSQLHKSVRSSTAEYAPTLQAISAASDDHVGGVIRRHLAELNDRVESGATPAGLGGRVSVFILGRYRHQASLMPYSAEKTWKHLDVHFSTIHASKGLEADYVIIPGLTRDKAAFPSRASDDPVLRLAMPVGEPFPHAEERRLFYVALTRARRAVTLVTVRNRESKFLVELVKEQGVRLVSAGGGRSSVIPCPACSDGTMTPRTGPHGRFYGCSNFPTCRTTMKLADAEAALAAG